MSCTLRVQDTGTVRAGSVGLHGGSGLGLLPGATPRGTERVPRVEADRPDPDEPAQALRIDASLSRRLSEDLKDIVEHLDAVADRLPTLSAHDAEAVLTGTVETLIALARGLRSEKAALGNGRRTSIRLIVERFVEARLSSPDVTPETLASDLEIPRATLYRAFSDVGGVATYVRNRRLAIARSLLLNPEECRAIGQIASSLGFVSNADFSKAFRKLYGRTPRSMRQLGGDLAAALRRRDGADRAA